MIALSKTEAGSGAEYVRELQRIALRYDPTASASARLTVIKELLKLEPAGPEQAAAGPSSMSIPTVGPSRPRAGIRMSTTALLVRQ